MRRARNYHLSEAQGLNSSLRASLPKFNFSPSNESSDAVVVGKWKAVWEERNVENGVIWFESCDYGTQEADVRRVGLSMKIVE
ncbi:hypothetical protein TIFTF001_008117 [Ficus carica]|uniref:Uncharacterized protein n=1 Tax=Ficus carica TaxID=3494 RepID=A0AA88DGV7_FICCA|nr:hypothetical protein TIFTF001_008117 [Ficus carica]